MINILPYNQKRTIRTIRYLRIMTVVVWGLIILGVAAGALFLPSLLTVNSRYAIEVAQTRHLEQSGVIVKAADVVDLQQRTKSIKDKLAAPRTKTPLEYIAYIRNHEGTGVRLTGFTVHTTEKPTISVVGVAPTRQSLQGFVDALKSDPLIESVESPVTNFVKSTQSEFTISVIFITS